MQQAINSNIGARRKFGFSFAQPRMRADGNGFEKPKFHVIPA
jgi:hypothetical protein